MKKTKLRKYAQLIAKAGVNVQKGQEVFIEAGLDQPQFVQMVVEECYRLGAKRVVVDWFHQPLEKLHVRHQSLKTLSELTDYQEARYKHYLDKLPCRIYMPNISAHVTWKDNNGKAHKAEWSFNVDPNAPIQTENPIP